MPEATSGGVLVKANNGHITRGGEFEQRAAFVPSLTLPVGTVGLFYNTAAIVVFGHAVAPVGIPAGITYQRLQHPTPATALVRVLSADLYAGKIYAVGEFADGAIYHFYDGARVTDWFDGRARATFDVVGGSNTPAVAAVGSFTITGGSAGGGNEITSIVVAGVSIISAPVAWVTSNSVTAAAVATAINSLVSSPDYAAVAVGATVTITAAVAGAAANGRSVVPTPGGTVTVGSVSNMAGGADAVTSKATDIKINGVSVISAPVSWATSNEDTAADVAAAINAYTSVPDYTASAAGTSISIAAAAPGPTPNGYAIAFTLADGFDVAPDTLAMADGAVSTNTYQPGEFVKTIGQKMYSVSGPNMHFSGIKEPTKWRTDAVGAGFIDMSSETSGSEELTALARYQTFVAVFAEQVIQIWYVDPDPELNRQAQVLNNTGTGSPRSITQFGNSDLLYLNESGVRSLRARDSSNAAATTDIGVPVDELITAKLTSLDENERRQVAGIIEPSNGRFWLVMRDRIFVFSFFNGAKVSAWSTYDASYVDEDGNTVVFEIDDVVVFRRRVYVRSGNMIYVYGGLDTGIECDATVAEAWLPYLDANDPTRTKQFQGIDLAMRGLWEVSAALDPRKRSDRRSGRRPSARPRTKLMALSHSSIRPPMSLSASALKALPLTERPIVSAQPSSTTRGAMMTISRATVGDVRAVAMAMRSDDFEEFAATTFVDNRQQMAHDLSLRYGGRDDVLVGMADGEPVWIGGTIEAWPGVISLLFFATDNFPLIGRGTTRWIRRELFPRYLRSGVHRIQAISHGAHDHAHAWLRTLGLEQEAVFKGFGRGGEDFIQFCDGA